MWRNGYSVKYRKFLHNVYYSICQSDYVSYKRHFIWSNWVFLHSNCQHLGMIILKLRTFLCNVKGNMSVMNRCHVMNFCASVKKSQRDIHEFPRRGTGSNYWTITLSRQYVTIILSFHQHKYCDNVMCNRGHSLNEVNLNANTLW